MHAPVLGQGWNDSAITCLLKPGGYLPGFRDEMTESNANPSILSRPAYKPTGYHQCSPFSRCSQLSYPGLNASNPTAFLPYVMPPIRPTGRRTCPSSQLCVWLRGIERPWPTSGSMRFFSSLTASSRAQKFTPSRIARTPVFFPGVAGLRLSNSLTSCRWHSVAKTDSFTRGGLTMRDGAGCSPLISHSLTP